MKNVFSLLEQVQTIGVQQPGIPFQHTAIIKGADKQILRVPVNHAFFAKHYKGHPVVVEDCDTKQKETVKIEDYFAYLQQENAVSNYYLKDLKISKQLFNDTFVKKRLHQWVENWLNLLPLEIFPHLRWFYLGKKRNYSPFHYDVFNSAAWNILFEGTKAWFFIKTDHYIEKEELDRLTRSILAGSLSSQYDTYGCLQEPGDLLYVDSGIPHMVINVTNTLSFTENVVNSHNIEAVIKKTDIYNKEWSSVFKKLQKHVAQ